MEPEINITDSKRRSLNSSRALMEVAGREREREKGEGWECRYGEVGGRNGSEGKAEGEEGWDEWRTQGVNGKGGGRGRRGERYNLRNEGKPSAE